jgi:hypothetical protein
MKLLTLKKRKELKQNLKAGMTKLCFFGKAFFSKERFVLAGANRNKILEGVKFMLSKKRNWKNPFGDGKSGSRIIKILEGVA